MMLYEGLNPKGLKIPIDNLYFIPVISYDEYEIANFNNRYDVIIGGWYFDIIYKLTPFVIRCIKNKEDKLNNYNTGNMSNNGILKLNIFEKLVGMKSKIDNRIQYDELATLSNIKTGVNNILSNILSDSMKLSKIKGDEDIKTFINNLNKPLKYDEFMSINNSLYILNVSIIKHFDTIMKVMNLRKTSFITERQKSLKLVLNAVGMYNTSDYNYRNSLLMKAKDILDCNNIFENDMFLKLKDNLKTKYDISYVNQNGDEL